MRPGYWLLYILMLTVQVLLGNFLNLGQYVVICILPLLVLSLPLAYNSILVMVAAFLTGLAADFFTHGILGLSAAALVPVAFIRRWVFSLVFGAEIFTRGERLSLQKQGFLKMALAILISTAVYFAIFTWTDAAGTRSLEFNTLRWLFSTLASTAAQLMLAGFLISEETARWK